ncbi:MAG: Trk system potassium transporter TrkA, partial [Alphaproteobacteria bacterium]
EQNCPVVNTPLRQLTGLFPDLKIVVVAVVRGDRAFVPASSEQMLPGDDVYFTVDAEHISRAMAAFGHEEREARRIIIVGGGNIGLFLAEQLEADQPGLSAKVIEADPVRAELVARALSRFTVLEGDALDADLLEQANVGATETIVAVTNDDETNILASLLAKRHGCQRAVTLINKAGYIPLVGTLGIDVVVSPRALTVSTILQHVRRGRIRAAHSLRDGFAEVIEAEALETSGLLGQPLREIDLPPGVIIGAVVRGDEVILPRGDMVLKVHDRVIMLAMASAAKKVEKLFSVRLEFF